MNAKDLKQQAFEANLQIVEHSLVILTWGNASVYNKEAGIIAIKPSGVSYKTMKWQDIVLVDMENKVIDSKLRPSSDTATHLELYKGFNGLGGIVHTHSTWATIWAQAEKPIPVLGTTHSDHFFGDIPCIPLLEKDKVDEAYEIFTGKQIVETYRLSSIEPLEMPGCLLANHAPFSWGKSVSDAVENAVAMEQCAMMAYHTLILNQNAGIPDYLLNKHYTRKHGKNLYYGQID